MKVRRSREFGERVHVCQSCRSIGNGWCISSGAGEGVEWFLDCELEASECLLKWDTGDGVECLMGCGSINDEGMVRGEVGEGIDLVRIGSISSESLVRRDVMDRSKCLVSSDNLVGSVLRRGEAADVDREFISRGSLVQRNMRAVSPIAPGGPISVIAIA
jgi:hypothetical protein